ncbi:hypothetical protein LTR56_000710 [Elasticomyces elasticus]|nr:hypothetical protein LTR22_013602 [Elasticomyces elasticus]KAK3660334.1 hypothetical protein LTR56_000710 [Elasticomyces elasticus]KAK4929273.1 hypothetical protein LTR49_004170 [Elasticomyces elasticus]KAK5765829.1 hypothetical protein LTS12_004089 [Elasticomyces elasticus]
MAPSVEPNYTSSVQIGDHCEQEPVDWPWLTDFTAELSSSTQYSLPSYSAGMLSVDDPSNCSFVGIVPTTGINCSIGIGHILPALPGAIGPRAEAPMKEVRTVASHEPFGKDRGVLQEYTAKSKRRKTANIPGLLCFSIMPEGTKARRQTSRAAQENVNKLRKRGACMLCRIKNVKYLRKTAFSYVTTTKPQWSGWATGRPHEYDSFKCIKLLAIAYTVTHRVSDDASSASPEVDPANWSHFASDVLGLVDGFIRRKKFWEDRNSALILTATMDLLMGICLDMALHVHERRQYTLFSEDTRIFPALIERCKFCVRKVMSFRKIMLQRLDTTESTYLEEAAFATLCKVSPRPTAIGSALEILHDMRTQVYRVDRCGSSKELLLLQSVHLNDTELLEESLNNGANPFYAREAMNKRHSVMELATAGSTRNQSALSKLQTAAHEFERLGEGPPWNDVTKANDSILDSVRKRLLAYFLERRKSGMAYALSGSTSDLSDLLFMAVSHELEEDLSEFDMTTAVLEAGTDLSARNADGETALMVAVQSSSPCAAQCVQLLLAHGADVNAHNVASLAALSGTDNTLEKLYVIVAYLDEPIPENGKHDHAHQDVPRGTYEAVVRRLLGRRVGDYSYEFENAWAFETNWMFDARWAEAHEAVVRLLLECGAIVYSNTLLDASWHSDLAVVCSGDPWCTWHMIETTFDHCDRCDFVTRARIEQQAEHTVKATRQIKAKGKDQWSVVLGSNSGTRTFRALL